ncbi:acyl-CoA synthetase [Rhizobium rhizosphaerae]|uniref:3-methylmercaptopropionyl-CoA ligase n=1 Tax=Xaviernesmea rhizosphaerae TaxID=1672749 RepID=A0A1Q9AHL8_9HYPH|nr:AMP-binding protein [Xaviernesmea rhizosphaerae]OLP54691.1 acyl-CoA synthetase [Xaviernesmea rhizosphaerae]
MHDWLAPDPVGLHAQARPDKLALVDLASGRRWTYRAFDRAIEQARAVLDALGLRPGDRLAAIARNSADLVIAQQACLRSGLIFTPLNWRLAAAELDAILADCTPALILADGSAAGFTAPAGARLMEVAAFAARYQTAAPGPRGPARNAGEPCVILYTSGTSGLPKGVILTPQTLFFTGVNFGVLGQVSANSVFLAESPMFHVIGLVTSIWPALVQGGTVLVSSGFDPAMTNARLADRALAITHYFCVPQMAQALRDAPGFAPDTWSLAALFTGGGPNPPANIRWWLEHGVRMVDGYGMTEAGTILGMPLDPALIGAHAGAVGQAGPATAIRIIDEEGGDVPDNAAGEIIVKGPHITPGYWNRPKEHESAFTRDGWLRTGDIAVRDAEGFVTIVDRRKDMFISGGENVYPVEIESVLAEHPAVALAAVIGVPDPRWGEVGHAFILLAPGHEGSESELRAHCEARLARFKVPKHFRIVEDLPRTSTGKIRKNRLRESLVV